MVSARTVLYSVVAGCFALLAATHVDATNADPVMWILVHHAMKQARIDPIVTPGGVSSHVHSLVGANGVSAFTTNAEELNSTSTCTTAGIDGDKSAYWAPTLYSFNPSNNSFSPKSLDYVNTYYLMRGNVPITAFPRGLQLLAGNAMRRGNGPTKQADNTASFVCLNYKDGSSQWPTLPPGPCPQGLRTQVLFPSCWNGVDLTSPDHSHVVYPMGDNADNGPCPASHNVRLPTLFYEFVWGVHDDVNTGNSTWVFSNGDSIGYSFHADFIAAWEEDILQGAIDECAGLLFNNLESCPPLAKTLDRAGAAKCTAESTEAVSGSIPYLPGCNVIWNGPHAGKGLTPGCDPSKVMLHPLTDWPPAGNATTAASNSTTTSNSTSSSTVASSSTSSASSSTAVTSTVSSVSSTASSPSASAATTTPSNSNNSVAAKAGAVAGAVGNALKNKPAPVPVPAPVSLPKLQPKPKTAPKPAPKPVQIQKPKPAPVPAKKKKVSSFHAESVPKKDEKKKEAKRPSFARKQEEERKKKEHERKDDKRHH